MHIFLLLLGCISVSSSAVFVNLSDLPSLALIVYRLFFACLLMLPYLLLKHRAEFFHIETKTALLIALNGVFFAVHLLTFFQSLRYTGIAEANMLMCTEVLFIAVYEWLFKKLKISWKGWLCLIIALIAAYFVITGRNVSANDVQRSASEYLKGNALATASAIFSALYTLVGRRVRKSVSMPVYTFNLYLVALLIALSALLLRGVPLFGYAVRNVWLALGMSLATTIMGHNMFSLGLKYLKASVVSSMKLTVPVFGAVLAYIVFGQVPGLQVIVASAVLLLSIASYIRVEKRD